MAAKRIRCAFASGYLHVTCQIDDIQPMSEMTARPLTSDGILEIDSTCTYKNDVSNKGLDKVDSRIRR